jgi:prolyl-tRNA synthetase
MSHSRKTSSAAKETDIPAQDTNTTTLPIGKAEAKKPTSKAGKQPKAENKQVQGGGKKKKIEGAEMIGIDISKDDDFSGWYQQVLTKGDMLDYYDVSGCYILKPASYFTARSQCLYPRMF